MVVDLKKDWYHDIAYFNKLKYKKGFGVYAFICISYYTYKNASLQIYKNESGNQNDRFL